jgi:DNA-binding transcriptional LysR family regulator
MPVVNDRALLAALFARRADNMLRYVSAPPVSRTHCFHISKTNILTNLDDLKVFERVAALESFSAAGRALKIPKSTVSRCVSRLESHLGVRLIQRTTHSVRLTQAGLALKAKCTAILAHVDEAIDSVGRFNTAPKGALKINATIGFSYFVLAETLPTFMDSYPGVEVSIDLTTHPVDLVTGGIDVAIRMGNLPDSRLVATGLGTMQKYLCASPSYLDRRGVPLSVKDLRGHDTIETPCRNGMSRIWEFHKSPGDIEKFTIPPRLLVNDPGMIYRLVLNGAGIAHVPGYLSAPDILAGRLTRLLPAWTSPPIDVSLVYPSSRGLSPIVRAFVGHMKQIAASGKLWLDDPIAKVSRPQPRPNYSKRSRPTRT